MDVTIRPEWDGTSSVLIDGEVVLERKSLEECRDKAQFLETQFAVNALKQKLTQPPA